jgi:uncharacterized protein YbjQ (UPF0145 family)
MAMRDLMEFLFFIGAIGVGYFVGSFVEKEHYRSIKEREAALLHLPAVTGKNLIEDNKEIMEARLVSGSVVISHDYFKLVFAGLRNLLGGSIFAYETLLDRGRREAILRLKENATGADIILNTRLETSRVSKGGSIEVLAYGTAVYYKK